MDDVVDASAASSLSLPRIYAYTGVMVASRICRRWQKDPLGGWWESLSPGEQAYYIAMEQVWAAEDAAGGGGGASKA